MYAESLIFEKVDIIGPPPPARLDHAMCMVHLPTIPATTTSDCGAKLPTPPTCTATEGKYTISNIAYKL